MKLTAQDFAQQHVKTHVFNAIVDIANFNGVAPSSIALKAEADEALKKEIQANAENTLHLAYRDHVNGKGLQVNA